MGSRLAFKQALPIGHTVHWVVPVPLAYDPAPQVTQDVAPEPD